jgi:hypothetical protein
MNSVLSILYENCSTFKIKNEMQKLTESESVSMTNSMISTLYKSVIDKSHVNYDTIIDSKGDITKYEGYSNMVECINILSNLVKSSDIETVNTAINNMVLYTDKFQNGFKLNREFVITYYISLVRACVESVSILISTFIDYSRLPDTSEFKVKAITKTSTEALSIEVLRKFNKACKNGETGKVLTYALSATESDKFIGSAISIGAVVVSAVAISIIILRELVYYFYYNRMKISDYLTHQALFLELNKNNIEMSSLPANKKDKVLKKQTNTIKTLSSLSDKISVNEKITTKKTKDAIKSENKNFKYDDVKSEISSMDDNGFSLL